MTSGVPKILVSELQLEVKVPCSALEVHIWFCALLKTSFINLDPSHSSRSLEVALKVIVHLRTAIES